MCWPGPELVAVTMLTCVLATGLRPGVDYNKMMMQLDSSTGNYSDIGEQTLGHKGATLK